MLAFIKIFGINNNNLCRIKPFKMHQNFASLLCYGITLLCNRCVELCWCFISNKAFAMASFKISRIVAKLAKRIHLNPHQWHKKRTVTLRRCCFSNCTKNSHRIAKPSLPYVLPLLIMPMHLRAENTLILIRLHFWTFSTI